MLQYHPSEAQFPTLSADANTIPVYCELLSDQLTPVSAFHRIAEGASYAFLLESVVGGEKIARYSFLSANPRAIFSARGDQVTLQQGETMRQWQSHDPFSELQSLLTAYRSIALPELPRFNGGAVGYAAYDAVRYFEHLPDAPPDDRNLPDLHFCIYDDMVVFDHVQKRIKIVAHAHLDDRALADAYADAVSRIDQLVDKLGQVTVKALAPMVAPDPNRLTLDSTFAQPDFERAVDRCKEYIRAGDVFQVVISQRLSVQCDAAPFDIYRALRAINPSPFMFYLKSPEVTLVGASPEILVRVEDGMITTRPLAGTRPRGATDAEDAALEAELLADPKERAEHVMLVDLGRNDVGRVAEFGSIKIGELMTVERYAHVMHICSNVTGKMRGDKTAFDALRAVLPVGTVSGAPKVRAMQIIDEMEPTRRGPYGGAVGYVDFAGNMDTCIALRTLVITDQPDGGRRVDAQVGAGIVADSEPVKEYRETMAKAASLLTAIDIAQRWR